MRSLKGTPRFANNPVWTYFFAVFIRSRNIGV